MPVHLVGDVSSQHNSKAEFEESSAKCIHIGLINNMPDAALRATERQFLSLLNAAASGVVVRLSFYALPDIPRTAEGRGHVKHFYSSIENLWESRVDGLIVTGTEPRAWNLTDEPYWRSFEKVLEWADENTHSAVWSCLAAHAATLHMDGIHRRRLTDKRFGVFNCERTLDHPLTVGVPSTFQVPHSRWNDIPGNELLERGYRVLARTMDGGVDAFVKQRKSLFVFFQGHPEYEASTLLLEYRRDVGSYLRCERETYPPMPQGYFDQGTVDVFTNLRERALLNRREELLADFPTAQLEKRVVSTWRSMATAVYSNWLAYLCAQKERRLMEKHRRPSEPFVGKTRSEVA